MKRSLLFGILLVVTTLVEAKVGTYNFRFTYGCQGTAIEDLEWYDYYLGPTLNNESHGNCLVNPAKECHAFQQFATFFYDENSIRSKETICDELGLKRCELLTVFIERDSTNTADQLTYERLSQKGDQVEVLETNKISINSPHLQGAFYLQGEGCLNEINYQVIKVKEQK